MDSQIGIHKHSFGENDWKVEESGSVMSNPSAQTAMGQLQLTVILVMHASHLVEDGTVLLESVDPREVTYEAVRARTPDCRQSQIESVSDLCCKQLHDITHRQTRNPSSASA